VYVKLCSTFHFSDDGKVTIYVASRPIYVREKNFIFNSLTVNYKFNIQPIYNVLHSKTNIWNMKKHKYRNKIRVNDY
jgi:predicted Zn-dependent protease